MFSFKYKTRGESMDIATMTQFFKCCSIINVSNLFFTMDFKLDNISKFIKKKASIKEAF